MAYPSKIINEGSFGSYQASVAIALYQRCYFNTAASTDGSGKPKVAICGATDRADLIAMQPIASGAFGTFKFANSPGEQYGVVSGTIGLGVAVYQAAAGAITAASGGGALLCGKSTSTGADGGTLTYLPVIAAA